MLPPPPPPISHYWGGGLYMYIFAFIKLVLNRQIQILFYHTTRGLEWETVLCMIIAPSEGF